MAKSRLTRIEIGMMELSKMSMRMNWIGKYFSYVFCNRMNPVVSSTMIMNSTFDR